MASCGDGASDGNTLYWYVNCPFPEEFKKPDFTALPENVQKWILNNTTVTHIVLHINFTFNDERTWDLRLLTSHIFDKWEDHHIIDYVREKFPQMDIPTSKEFEIHGVDYPPHLFEVTEFKFNELFCLFRGPRYEVDYPDRVTLKKFQLVLKNLIQQYYFV